MTSDNESYSGNNAILIRFRNNVSLEILHDIENHVKTLSKDVSRIEWHKNPRVRRNN